MSVTYVLNQMCETCRNEAEAFFAMDPRLTPTIIAGDLYHTKCCFIADEIIFNKGKLIFAPGVNADGKPGQYCSRYFVICRKIKVIGGGPPFDGPDLGPCDPENPGQDYKQKNVITWKDRLVAAPAGLAPGAPGSPIPTDAAAVGSPSWDRNVWQDQGQGNNGKDGGDGSDGLTGTTGVGGMSAPDFTLVCLEVETDQISAHLIIDFDGQVGGAGGRGQHGGQGGDGMGGRPGESDNTWPGEGCDRASGNGGDGGDHGRGGTGGKGGKGGDGGDIDIVASLTDVTVGFFVSGDVSYVNDGGNEGQGGLGGFGEGAPGAQVGKGGRGGHQAPQHCSAGLDGDDGASNWPPYNVITNGSDLNAGPDGAMGVAGNIKIYPVISHQCTDFIPVDVKVDTVEPAILCRGFDTAETNLQLTLEGLYMGQVTSVGFSLAGVTASIGPLSDETTMNLLVDLTGASGVGPCDIILNRALGAPQVVSGMLTIQRFEVLSIAPAAAAQGATVQVTITGTCFDPTAINQQVLVSGVGINVSNVVVVNTTTVSVELEIGNAAVPTQRDVTVVNGARSHTLVNALNVTL